MEEQQNIEPNASTEEKIKEAARRVFTRKGFAATRTRDIAEESGFNLALINYYFRSKEKLFDMVMLENLNLFIHSIISIVNNSETTLEEKIDVLIVHYIDMLNKNPDLPVFIMNEIHQDPEKLMAKAGFDAWSKDVVLVKQIAERVMAGKMPPYSPIHIVMNILSLTIFPFVAGPMLKNRIGLDGDGFKSLMEERKKLIPKWVKGMLQFG